jgi:predicted GNAT superfamily acetyltransferase
MIRIADISEIDHILKVRDLEIEVWRLDPIDVLPVTMLVATSAAGAILLGAYDGDALVGFAYGFPGFEDGRTTIHSHMLAVKPGYRGHDLGYRLKLAQRDRALALGVSEMTWTFDPLQSLNAHFNFGKLGVVTDTYKIDFYGNECSSFLLRGNTDRFWVRWLLDSARVRSCIAASDSRVVEPDVVDAPALVDTGEDGAPRLADASVALGGERAIVEIPDDINAIQRTDTGLASMWRETTRRAFTDALAAGYVVDAFLRPEPGARRHGAYVLRRARIEDLA